MNDKHHSGKTRGRSRSPLPPRRARSTEAKSRPPVPPASIEYLDPKRLQPSQHNPRTHSKKQLRQIRTSIETFGFTNPVLIDESDTILAGHGRVEAAVMMRLDSVPCLRFDTMTPAEKRAYVIADNKLALNAGWDEEMLAIELGALLTCDLDFDVNVTGFSASEIDGLIEGLSPEEDSDPRADALPADHGPPISCLGDVWQLGPHRVICGDALSNETFDALLDDEKARMAFTDPPYNVRIGGHAGGSGGIQHGEFEMASGEMTPAAFAAFLETTFRNIARHCLDGSIHFICMDWRHMSEILEAGANAYSEMMNLIVWAKDIGGMGTFYRSRHELIFVFKNGTAPHCNNFELG